METGAGFPNSIQKEKWKNVLTLAYQSLGVVYGDLSTSPIYVYRSTFADDIHHSETNDEIYGVLSFVFWTLTLIPLLKYVFVVLRADDNGEGGTFALYTLLCRRVRINALLSSQKEDEDLSEYCRDTVFAPPKSMFELMLKSILERNKFLQRLLLVLTLIGTCMVIGDGVLTPALSVYSAVSGLELALSIGHHNYLIVPISCLVLICLFALQHYGTHRVGFIFAPVVLFWLLCMGTIGVYNIVHWNPHVYKALSPYYMYAFLRKTKLDGWRSLGGILLCITGSEAMFADLGHFSQLSVKIAFTSVVYPCLVLAYMGQAAFLSCHHFDTSERHVGFYESVPDQLRWPVLAIAILAAVVGSQAIITGSFSIIKQCSSLGFFPRVKVVHTSHKIHGQIYIPEINWILMILCLAVTAGFRDTKRMGNAAGLAVMTVILVTTLLMSLVIVLCWQKSAFLALCFVLLFGTVEALYFSASLVKFLEGAWVPVALSLIFLCIMCVWHYGTLKKYDFDIQHKVHPDALAALDLSVGVARVPGIGFMHTELASGIPSIFSHFVTNLLAYHRIMVFLCIKSIPIPHVRSQERFLISRIGCRDWRLYRCIIRYGYRDSHDDDTRFEQELVQSIAMFIQTGGGRYDPSGDEDKIAIVDKHSLQTSHKKVKEEPAYVNYKQEEECREADAGSTSETGEEHWSEGRIPSMSPGDNAELEDLLEAREAGTMYIIGHTFVRATPGSSLVKKLVLNYGYECLRRNSRSLSDALCTPHVATIEIGMLYRV